MQSKVRTYFTTDHTNQTGIYTISPKICASLCCTSLCCVYTISYRRCLTVKVNIAPADGLASLTSTGALVTDFMSRISAFLAGTWRVTWTLDVCWLSLVYSYVMCRTSVTIVNIGSGNGLVPCRPFCPSFNVLNFRVMHVWKQLLAATARWLAKKVR